MKNRFIIPLLSFLLPAIINVKAPGILSVEGKKIVNNINNNFIIEESVPAAGLFMKGITKLNSTLIQVELKLQL